MGLRGHLATPAGGGPWPGALRMVPGKVFGAGYHGLTASRPGPGRQS
jgi:hypothetical protein